MTLFYRTCISSIITLGLSGCGSDSDGTTPPKEDVIPGETVPDENETSLIPYHTERYQNVIDASSLQTSDPEGNSGNKTTYTELNDYADDSFYIDNASQDLTFTMTGYSNRAELRVLNNFSTANINYQQRLVANVLPIAPMTSVANSEPSKDSFTLLQVHNKGTVSSNAQEGILSHPLLRITWEQSRSLNGIEYSSYYWAVLKTNAYECAEGKTNSFYGEAVCDNAYLYFPLTDFVEDKATHFEIIAGNSTLVVKVDGITKINQDISYWDALLSYFKVGVYNQFHEGTSEAQFSTLEYYGDEKTNNSYDLDPSVAPSDNFDLLDWYLSIPIDEGDGYSTSIKEKSLDAGYEDQFFYTGSDGGMVFHTPIKGVTTSSGTKYVRTELREMLRRGDTSLSTKGKENNWAFSSIPTSEQASFAGINGTMEATLAINHVTTTSSKSSHVGRIVIGQIHAKNNEPIRLYYHKLPDNERGALYFAHETSKSKGGNETWYNLLGNMVYASGSLNNEANPNDGIALDETFSYAITVEGDRLIATLSQNGIELASKEISMVNSGYNDADNYMYFKAGIYLQDNSSHDDDYAEVTFYELSNSHESQ